MWNESCVSLTRTRQSINTYSITHIYIYIHIFLSPYIYIYIYTYIQKRYTQTIVHPQIHSYLHIQVHLYTKVKTLPGVCFTQHFYASTWTHTFYQVLFNACLAEACHFSKFIQTTAQYTHTHMLVR